MYSTECAEKMQWPQTYNLQLNEQIQINYIKISPKIDNNQYVVVYSHSNSENIFEIKGILQELADFIQTPIVAYDYPGYGNSTKVNATEENCNQSLNIMIQETIKQYQNRKIILWGRSVGCYHSCNAAKQNNIAALIMQSPFVTIGNIICRQCTCKCQKTFNNAAQILQIPNTTKILLIHGQKDQVVGKDASQILFDLYSKAKCNSSTELKTYQDEDNKYRIEEKENICYGLIYGGDHNNLDTCNENEFKEILKYFFKQLDPVFQNIEQQQSKAAKRSLKDNVMQLYI